MISLPGLKIHLSSQLYCYACFEMEIGPRIRNQTGGKTDNGTLAGHGRVGRPWGISMQRLLVTWGSPLTVADCHIVSYAPWNRGPSGEKVPLSHHLQALTFSRACGRHGYHSRNTTCSLTPSSWKLVQY